MHNYTDALQCEYDPCPIISSSRRRRSDPWAHTALESEKSHLSFQSRNLVFIECCKYFGRARIGSELWRGEIWNLLSTKSHARVLGKIPESDFLQKKNILMWKFRCWVRLFIFFCVWLLLWHARISTQHMNVSIRKKIKWNGTHRRLKSAARIWSILGVCSTEEKSETFKARNSRNLIYFCYLFFLPCPCHLSFFFDFDSLIRLLIARALRNIKIFLSEFLAVEIIAIIMGPVSFRDRCWWCCHERFERVFLPLRC